MLENGIEKIVNSLASFGKVNVILYIKAYFNEFDKICNEVIRLFKPDEVERSLFDLDRMEMMNIEISAPIVQNGNSIVKTIFIREKEEIIVEYYKEQFILEHIFVPDYIQVVNGSSIIEKFYKKNNSILIVGYELSVNIDSYESSLNENISDESLYPIILVKNNGNGNFLLEEYASNSSKVNRKKVEIIRMYLKLIGIK